MNREHDGTMDRDLQLIRELADRSDAPESEVINARRMLQQAIAAEKAAPRRSWLPRLVPAFGAVAVLVIVAVIGTQFVRPTTAFAALNEVATVAERLDPLVVPPGQAVYVRSERTDLVQFAGEDFPGMEAPVLSLLVPQVREVWVRAGGGRRIAVTAAPPVFFDAAGEAAFSGSAAEESLAIGRTVTTELAAPEVDLPLDTLATDPELLRAQILELNAAEESGRSETVKLFETATALLRETAASPALRGAAVRVLAALDDAVEVTSDEASVTVAIDYEIDGFAYTRSIRLDRATSALVGEMVVLVDGDAEAGVPPGTALVDATYSEPTVVTLP